MIEVQCTSCHTRYRIDEQVLPEGLPTFKCSRCGHVFTFEPRKSRLDGSRESATPKAQTATDLTGASSAYSHPPDPAERTPGAPGRIFRTGSPSSSESSGAASNSDISYRSPAEAYPSHFQSGPTEDEEPAPETPERESVAFDAPRAPKAEPRPDGIMSPPRPVLSPQPRLKQDEEGYSRPIRPITGKDPDAASGENLSFDFSDEERGHDQGGFPGRRSKSRATEPSDSDSEKWEVGDDELAPSSVGSTDNELPGAELARPRRKIRASDAEPEFSDDAEFVDEEAAPVYNRATTHSARFFVGLVFLVCAAFAVLTLLIRSAPEDSSVGLSYLPIIGDRFVIPATPAKLVALRDVYAAYQRSKEGQNTLVISGTAENIGTASLRIVQLTAALRDAQRRSLASETVYCGNSLSASMIGQMTPHEIKFFQKLEPAGTFALEPSGSCRFVAVFMNPPSAAHAYDVSVSQAVPGMAANAEEPAS